MAPSVAPPSRSPGQSVSTSLLVTAQNDVPTLSGVATTVTLTDHQTVAPFSGVTISDR